ncbi:thiol S-methyltransferase TMT1A-like [Ptychodera flava]|uniref:thiol S-methyltransferase TMT1A-like n=1 Tax=Ptychodera flava TaxID=63121 RepID=UPI00396A63B7
MEYINEIGLFWAPRLGAALIGTWLFFRILLAFYESLVFPIVFPAFMRRFTEMYNKNLDKVKGELFWDMPYIKKCFEGQLTILELGAGTGANFSYYPEGCSVIPVEPMGEFEGYLKSCAKQYPGLTVNKVVKTAGEDLSSIPDESVHAVVATLVLCRVSDVEKVVEEIKRVLKPKGKFYFIENIAGHRDSWTRAIQRFVCPVWSRLFGGCQLTMDTWKYINKAGFYKVEYQKISAPLPSYCHLLRPHVVGFAVKK